MSIISEVEELLAVGEELGIDVELLNEKNAEDCIKALLNSFAPFKTTGHLGINNDSVKLPLDKWEYTYMEHLSKEVGYVFFEQSSNLSKKTVIKINDIRLLGKILEKSFGMEYFLTNEGKDFLIAVNWYVVEIAGDVKVKFKELLKY